MCPAEDVSLQANDKYSAPLSNPADACACPQPIDFALLAWVEAKENIERLTYGQDLPEAQQKVAYAEMRKEFQIKGCAVSCPASPAPVR
jgi:hypothetical protein